ncbi:MAG: HNH endonuclease [Actinomycetota bacterium]|nr:HNH endonuclease [Actinomycetota bacterium]
MDDVLLINASYQVMTRIAWQRAIVLVVTDAADVHEAHASRVIRSQHLTVPLPTIVRLRHYVHVPYSATPRGEAATRAKVLLRDRRTCVYCAGRGETIDHIVPRSRGGPDTWDNLAACCGACNNRKGDRTPLEAGMKLLWLPRSPSIVDADQERVWRGLADTG